MRKFAVQNSDLILSLAQLIKATGSPINTFARGAKKIMLDIDKSEIDKFTKFNLKIDLKINQDLKIFCKKFLKYKFKQKTTLKLWHEKIKKWKQKYPICIKLYFSEK